MPHINTQPGEHDATSSAYIVLLSDKDEPRIWLHMHKKLGKWLQFGGHVERNETPWQAVVHEIEEESGYDITQLRILQPKIRILHLTGAKIHPSPILENTHDFGATDYEHYHTDRAYAFVTDQQPAHEVAEREQTEKHAMTRSEIMQVSDDLPADVREVCRYIFDQILDEYDQIDSASFEL